MPFSLPNGTPAESARFMRLLQSMPDEIKVQIIQHAVKSPRIIDLSQFSQQYRVLTAPFTSDRDMHAIAKEEVLKVNTFATADPDGQYGPVARHVRHLIVRVPVFVEADGQWIDSDSNFMIENDVKFLKSLPTRFTNLGSLTVEIVDTREIKPEAWYKNAQGRKQKAERCPTGVRFERAFKMLQFADLVKGLKLQGWREGIKVEKTLKIMQDHLSNCAIRIREPRSPEECTDVIAQILDNPVSVIKLNKRRRGYKQKE